MTMTTEQAAGVWKSLMASFPNQVIEGPTQAEYLKVLRALPWRDGRTADAVEQLTLTWETPFLPPKSALVKAAGVAPEAAHLLSQAIHEGVELVPDAASRTGWAVGEPARPLPNGAIAALPEPGGVPEPTPPSAFTEEQRRANLARLGGLFREMTSRGKAAS